MPVTVNLGWYVIADVPLFYVMIGSLLFGLVLSYLINIIHAISNSFAMRGKNKEIKKEKGEVLELTKQVHKLELENEKQKNDKNTELTDTDAL